MKTLGVLVLLAVAAAVVPMPAGDGGTLVLERDLSADPVGDDRRDQPRTDRVAGCRRRDPVAIGLMCVRAPRAVDRRPRAHCCAGGVAVVACAAVLYLLFLGLWGLNYRRVPLERKLDYERARVTRDAAMALANTAAGFMNRGYPAAHADASGHCDRSSGRSRTCSARSARDTTRLPGVPKRSVLTWYFRRAAIDGMTDPFFLEIIINPEVLDIERPFVVAHEWAHLAGYADRIGGELRGLVDLRARAILSRSTAGGSRRTSTPPERCRARTGAR